MTDDRVAAWIDKLEIRELIETSMRHLDDERGDRFAECFEEDGAMQLSGTVFAGRDALRGSCPQRRNRVGRAPGHA